MQKEIDQYIKMLTAEIRERQEKLAAVQKLVSEIQKIKVLAPAPSAPVKTRKRQKKINELQGFTRMVWKTIRDSPGYTVAFYAERLEKSPKYMSSICGHLKSRGMLSTAPLDHAKRRAQDKSAQLGWHAV